MQAQAIRSPLGAFVRSPLGVRQTKVNEGYLYLWCLKDGSMRLRKYKLPGLSLVWNVDDGAGYQFNRISAGADNALNTVDGTSAGLIRQYSKSDGSVRWTEYHGALLHWITTDEIGNVYVVGEQDAGNYTTRKYSSAGFLLWSVSHGDRVRGVGVDGFGNVYTSGDELGDHTSVRKYDSNGNLIWSAPYLIGASTYTDGGRLVSDNEGNIYVGNFVSPYRLIKYDTNGNKIWEHETGDTIRDILVGPDGLIYYYILSAVVSVNSATGASVKGYSFGTSTGAGKIAFGSINNLYSATVYGYVLAKFKIGTSLYIWRKTTSEMDTSAIFDLAWSPT